MPSKQKPRQQDASLLLLLIAESGAAKNGSNLAVLVESTLPRGPLAERQAAPAARKAAQVEAMR
jgi:hypothetical protein